MGSTQPHLPRHSALEVPAKLRPIDGGIHIISERNRVPHEEAKVKDAYISVKQNVGTLSRRERLPLISLKIRELLDARKIRQADLADICAVSRVQVSRWIHEYDLPSASALLAISEIVSHEERQWWRDQAAIQAGTMKGKQVASAGNWEANTSALLPVAESIRTIHFITNSNNSGADVEECLDLPRQWFLRDHGEFRALRVQGRAICDAIEGEAIAVIDVSHRDPKSLVDCVVVARGVEGPVVNWLREDQGHFMLQPLRSGPLKFVTFEDGDGSIIGRVVKWIGEAPCPRLPTNAQVARDLKKKARKH